uniref:Lipocalin/cytosolic fatty-acid binding domain-containing protein n=1 Tax=Pyxicephalus adspersus TaxID=30357 RepID=A0AAV3ADJ9_PYXAD|nr:TPA: hypothetical protein GDO54_018002 [Pyxicephalus adspersus]
MECAWSMCEKENPPYMILGQWTGVAAASNCKPFVQMRKTQVKAEHMPPPVNDYSFQNGKMKSTAAFQTAKDCQQMDTEMTIVEPGHYKSKTPYGENEIVIAGTDYTSFLFEYTQTKNGLDICVTVKLLGRTEKLSEEKIKQFKDNLKSLGLTEENYIKFHDKGNHASYY